MCYRLSYWTGIFFVFLAFSSRLGESFRPLSARSGIHCVSRQKTSVVWAEKDVSTAEKQAKAKGVYVRPSAVIEKGSGFFVPGLEGPRVRLAIGSVILLLTAVNHTFSSAPDGFQFAEGLAVFYSLLVLLQGFIESFREAKVVSISRDDAGGPSTAATTSSISQQWSSSNFDFALNNDEWKERVQWMATSYLSLTPATSIILLGGKEKDIIFSSGSAGISTASLTPDDRTKAIDAALETISKSSTGLVALPPSHPAYLLAPEKDNRCVVLQDITARTCLMMTSDQLVESFTKQDLQWLGQLARYLQQR